MPQLKGNIKDMWDYAKLKFHRRAITSYEVVSVIRLPSGNYSLVVISYCLSLVSGEVTGSLHVGFYSDKECTQKLNTSYVPDDVHHICVLIDNYFTSLSVKHVDKVFYNFYIIMLKTFAGKAKGAGLEGESGKWSGMIRSDLQAWSKKVPRGARFVPVEATEDIKVEEISADTYYRLKSGSVSIVETTATMEVRQKVDN